MNEIPVILPSGCWVDGNRYDDATIRPLNGEDEHFLAGMADILYPPHRATTILARCVTSLGPYRPVGAEMVRSLTIGDREALLLHLQRLTFGDRIEGVLACPNSECKKRMDLPLSVSQLLQPPYKVNLQVHEALITHDAGVYTIRFRLPTGADLESIVETAREKPDDAAAMLLQRCLISSRGPRGEETRYQDLPPDVLGRLSSTMSEIDPQADLVADVKCPECGYRFPMVIDTATLLFQEIRDSSKQLIREAHLLAYYYHWPESEIMAMTPTKRRSYVGMLMTTLSEDGRP